VWFPDPEVSDTLFYAHDNVESSFGCMTGRQLPCSQTNMLPNNIEEEEDGMHHSTVTLMFMMKAMFLPA
jgi:hypothetical protein